MKMRYELKFKFHQNELSKFKLWLNSKKFEKKYTTKELFIHLL